MSADPHPPIPQSARKNIENVAQIEKDLLSQWSPIDRLSKIVTRFAGSIYFLTAHLFWFAAWIFFNSVSSTSLHFDPFPFPLLNLMVSLEAIFLTTFVLMSQNRQSHQTEKFSHLDLQLSLLAEQEATKMLELLQSICDRLGMKVAANDNELKQLIEETHVSSLAKELEKARSPEEGFPPP